MNISCFITFYGFALIVNKSSIYQHLVNTRAKHIDKLDIYLKTRLRYLYYLN